MRKLIDRTGIKYNRLTALSLHSSTKNGTRWNCVCECGKMTVVASHHLVCGTVKSCGCWNMEVLLARMTKHKESKTGKISKEYKAWQNMKRRCLDKTNFAYKNYGGRGIKICNAWVNSYIEFLKDIGRAPSQEYSIDRINNNGNYEPKNCRWATKKQQMENRRCTRKKNG